MPRPVPLPMRQVIHRRVQQGDDVSEIATQLRLPVRTVRNLVHRFRDSDADLAPGYAHPQPAEISPLINEAVAMRVQHAGWGAGLIRVILTEEHPDQIIPSERTLRR